MNGFKRRLNVFIYGIYAGLAIALGGTLFLFCKAFIPDGSFNSSQLIGAFVFPIGLLMVCFLRMNLYTGKIGMAFRNKKLDKKGLNVFEWLLWILLGNAVGAFALGFAIYGLTLINKDSSFAAAVYAASSARAIGFDFDGIFGMCLRSLLCGALVYVAIYLFNRLPTLFGKVLGIVVPIAFFVYAGFQHCIANMFYIAAGMTWNANSMVGLLLCIVFNSVGALLLDLLVKYE